MHRAAALLTALLLAACQTAGPDTSGPAASYLSLPKGSADARYAAVPDGKALYRAPNGAFHYSYTTCKVRPYLPIVRERCERSGYGNCTLALLGNRDVTGLAPDRLDAVIDAYEAMLRSGHEAVSNLQVVTLPVARLDRGADKATSASFRLAFRTGCGGQVRIEVNSSVCDGDWRVREVLSPTPLQPIAVADFETACNLGGKVTGTVYMVDSRTGLAVGETGAGPFHALVGPSLSADIRTADGFRRVWQRRMSFGGYEMIEALKTAVP